MSLDALDTKILFALEYDSSVSLTTLAKEVRRSKETVHYRLERLKERGILRSCTAIVDMAKLGYLTFRIYIKWQNVTLAIKEQFYREVGKNLNVWTTTILHGKWDFAVFLGIKRDEYITKFHNIWNELLATYKPYIAEHKIAIYAPIHNYNKRFFCNETQIVSRVTGEGAVVEHDEIDEAVLLTYARDVRQSLSVIARATGVSVETVRRRIRDLERKQVIVGYKIDMDLAKLGFQGYRVDFSLNTTTRNAEIYEYLKEHKYFYQINKSIGGSDIETEVVVRDLTHLLELLEEIMTRFKGAIKSYEYFGYSEFPKLSIVSD